MIHPIIHNNGSGRQTLLDQMSEAIAAIEEAKRKVAALMPHPRDYYVHPQSGAYEIARIEHLSRMQMLEVARTEIEQLGMHILENSPEPR